MGKLQQKYIKDFVCLASNCPDTCCKGWQIYIDEKTGKDYLCDSGEIGKIARESMRGKPYSYHLALSNKRCPYLTQDNLCKVIQEKGENALSIVCSSHPRFTHILYEDEFSFLSLSCPFVASMFVSALKNGGVEYEKIDMQNPYLSQFYDTVCEESVNLGQKLAQICDKDKQLSLLCSSLFSSLEYLEEETIGGIIESFGEKLGDWIVNNLKKEIDKLFKTLPDKKNTSIIGSSMGGLFAFYMGLKYKDVFDLAGCFSPAFLLYENNKFIEELEKYQVSEELPKLYFLVGNIEFENEFIIQTKDAYDIFKNKGVSDEKIKLIHDLEGIHHESFWNKYLDDLFDFYENK